MAKKNSKKTVPELRFRGFTDPWEQRQLGEVAEIVGGGTPDSSNANYWGGNIDWYTPSEIGASRTVGTSARKITHEGLDHSSAHLLPAGSILFTSRASIGLMAFISRPSATNQGFQSLIPNASINPDFLYALGPYISRYARRHAAGSTFVEISGGALAKTPMRIPSLPEQRRIGEFFSTLDSLIAAAERQEALLRQKKQAYLQLMFPQDGETEPRLRFAGFSGEWERRQLGDAISAAGIKNKERQNFQSYSISNQSGFVPQSEQFDNGGKPLDADKSSYWIVAPRSFAYNPARINVGSIGYWDGEEPVIVSSLYEVFQTHESVDDSFLLNWFQTCLFTNQIAKRQEGGVRQYFFFDKLQESLISIPSLPEQRRIGAFFSALDNLIDAAEKRTKSLHTLKSAYLQRMFV